MINIFNRWIINYSKDVYISLWPLLDTTLIFRSHLFTLLVWFFEPFFLVLIVIINIWDSFKFNLLVSETLNESLSFLHLLFKRNPLQFSFLYITVTAIVQRVVPNLLVNFLLFALFRIEFERIIMPTLDNHLRK